MSAKRLLGGILVTLAGSLLQAAPAVACSVCYGANDSGSPLVTGARLGVFLLLAITMVVLGAFARFFLYLRNRARLAESEGIASQWAQLQRSSST